MNSKYKRKVKRIKSEDYESDWKHFILNLLPINIII